MDQQTRAILDRVQGISPANRRQLDQKASAEAVEMERARRQLWLLLRMTAEETERYGVKPKEKEELPPPLFMEDMVKTPFGYARRCDAKSKRSQERCRGIAIKGKTKCRTHGGASTGARTAAGRARVAEANRKHGRESRAQREKHRAHMRWFHEIEKLSKQLGIMLPMPRKPARGSVFYSGS